VSNLGDVSLPTEVVRDGETNNLHLRPLRDRLAVEEEGRMRTDNRGGEVGAFLRAFLLAALAAVKAVLPEPDNISLL
jgi:hypothetical protein